MKISGKLINIKDEESKFCKNVFSKGDYIKFLELLRDIHRLSE